MSDVGPHPGRLRLPRDEDGLATSQTAVRRLEELLSAFLERVAADANAEGYAVVLDGSVESALVAGLAVEALGEDQVVGLVMPAQLMDAAAAQQAEAVAETLGVSTTRVQLHPLIVEFQQVVGDLVEEPDDRIAMQNASERFRMACAYYVANVTGRLVAGTVNRTRWLLGTVTKYGGTGVDVAVLGDLYRTEVEGLADGLTLPTANGAGRIPELATPAADGRAQLDVNDRTLDGVLRALVDEEETVATVAARFDVDRSVVRQVSEWCERTRHKRRQPLRPSMVVGPSSP